MPEPATPAQAAADGAAERTLNFEAMSAPAAISALQDMPLAQLHAEAERTEARLSLIRAVIRFRERTENPR